MMWKNTADYLNSKLQFEGHRIKRKIDNMENDIADIMKAIDKLITEDSTRIYIKSQVENLYQKLKKLNQSIDV